MADALILDACSSFFSFSKAPNIILEQRGRRRSSTHPKKTVGSRHAQHALPACLAACLPNCRETRAVSVTTSSSSSSSRRTKTRKANTNPMWVSGLLHYHAPQVDRPPTPYVPATATSSGPTTPPHPSPRDTPKHKKKQPGGPFTADPLRSNMNTYCCCTMHSWHQIPGITDEPQAVSRPTAESVHTKQTRHHIPCIHQVYSVSYLLHDSIIV